MTDRTEERAITSYLVTVAHRKGEEPILGITEDARILSVRRPADWEPGRWWRVTEPDGRLWCETSVEREAREALRPGDCLERQWVRSESEWRTER